MPTIAETPTETLLEWRAAFITELGWGLSAQARKATEIKLGAIEYRLRERGAMPEDNIRILHAVDRLFLEFDDDRSAIEEAYTYASTETDLEQIWRWNNTVDGDEREQNTNHNKRSLSVGDVVGVRTFDGEWAYFAVAGMGWTSLSSTVVDHALERGKTFDPFVGL